MQESACGQAARNLRGRALRRGGWCHRAGGLCRRLTWWWAGDARIRPGKPYPPN